ncbi:MAG TPA: hypothetical protein VFE51_29695 [Verrucomicrobiae bacterium]|nr:hypothetical protein [Verrucomicrobiae bacterium]
MKRNAAVTTPDQKAVKETCNMQGTVLVPVNGFLGVMVQSYVQMMGVSMEEACRKLNVEPRAEYLNVNLQVSGI